jgi:hypothetical protein
MIQYHKGMHIIKLKGNTGDEISIRVQTFLAVLAHSSKARGYLMLDISNIMG